MDKQITLTDITGKGLIFPIIIENGSIKPKGGWDLLKSCIHNILAFEFGERYFQRDFGIALEPYIGEPNDESTEALISHKLQTQLPQWDKRLIIEDVSLNRRSPTALDILVTVSLSGTKESETITYPINNAI